MRWLPQIVFHYLSNMPLDAALTYGVHARFWMQPLLVLCIATGVGVAWLGAALVRRCRAYGWERRYGKAVAVVCLVLALGQYARHAPTSDQSRNT